MKNNVIKNFIIINIILFMSFNRALAVEHHKIVIAGDYWCPYNCLAQGDDSGYLVDLAKKVFKIYDISVEYKLMPWFEALSKVSTGEVDAIIGISDPDSRALLATKVPQGYSIISAFTKSNSDWVFGGIDSLRGKKLAIVLDYNISNVLQEYIATTYTKNPNWFVLESGTTASIDSINDLIAGRADIYVDDEAVINYYLDTHNLTDKIKNSGKLDEVPMPLFIAFSNKIPNASSYVKMLEDGINALAATGDLDDLKAKYRISHY